MRINKCLHLLAVSIIVSGLAGGCGLRRDSSTAFSQNEELLQSSASLNSTSTENISRQEENTEQIPESQVSSQESPPLQIPEEITGEERTQFQQYLQQNLSGDDYAYIDMNTSDKPPCIWVVNNEKLEAVVAAYTGKKPSFQKIQADYSFNEINQAIAEIEVLPMVVESYRKISSISCYEGFLDVLLLEPYEEFETYLASKYGAMVRVSVIGTNPTE